MPPVMSTAGWGCLREVLVPVSGDEGLDLSAFGADPAAGGAVVVDPVGVGQERQQPAGQDDAVPVAEFLLVGDAQGVLELQVFRAVSAVAAARGDDRGF